MAGEPQGHTTGTFAALRAIARHAFVPVLAAMLWLGFATHDGPVPEQDRKLSFVVDFRNYYRPNAEYLGARLADGQIPLWNPQQGLGAPFMATLQPGVLYPPNWLHAWLPTQPALIALAALHVALAAALAGALARRLGATPLGCACTSLLYVSSVTFLQSVWTPPLLAASALAPGVFLALDRVISRPSAARATALGAVVALQLFAGWPLTVVMTAYTAALYAGVRWATSARARLSRGFALLSGATLGGAFAAPLLIPAYELAVRSTRALGSVDRSQAVWIESSHDASLIFGQLLQWGASGGLPGLPALGLAALALFHAGPYFARIAALAVAALCFQLGSFPNDFPVYDAMRSLPLLEDFRFPFHYREMSALLFAVLAGVGLGRLPTRGGRTIRGLVAAVALGVPLWNIQALYVSMPRTVEPRRTLAQQLQRVAGQPDANHPPRVFWSNRQGKLGPPSRFHALYDLEPLTLARTAQLATFLEAGTAITVEDAAYRPPGMAPLDDAQKFALIPYYGRSRLPDEGSRASILDLLSIEWIITDLPRPWLSDHFVRIGRSNDQTIYRNPHALPRAYRVAATEDEPEALERALGRMVEQDFDPHQRVLLAPRPDDSREVGRGAAGPVEILEYAAERVRLRTRDTQAGFVVLTDAWYPGWQASVDGVAVPIYRANAAFRAVYVGAGEHQVELHYRPSSVRVGAWIAALAMLISVGAMALARRRTTAANRATPEPSAHA